jgi:hypothetical protein
MRRCDDAGQNAERKRNMPLLALPSAPNSNSIKGVLMNQPLPNSPLPPPCRTRRGKADRESPFSLEATFSPAMHSQHEAMMHAFRILIDIAIRTHQPPDAPDEMTDIHEQGDQS